MKIEKAGIVFFVFLTILFIIPQTMSFQTPQALEIEKLEKRVQNNLNQDKNNLIDTKINSDPVMVLFDESHTNPFGADFAPGPISALGGFLNTLGFETDVNQDSELTSSYLTSYDILVLFFPQEVLTTNEVDVILDFISSGGSLLVSGKGGWTYDNFVNLKSSNLNILTQKLNVTYDDIFGNNDPILTTFQSHPLSTNVTSLNFNTKEGKFTIDPNSGVSILANQSTGDPAFAYRDYGLGRVFFSAGEFVFRNLVGDDMQDHFQFAANVFNWLAKKPSIQVNFPNWMQIPVRKEFTTTQIERRNYNMYLGTTHVHSDEGSGDSSTPVVDQIDRARELDLDYFALTDHHGGTPQNSWAPAATYLIDNNITDLNILYGVESDVLGVGHHSTFGITEIQSPGAAHTLAEWSDVINTYKAQGGLIMMAHPFGCCGIPSQSKVDYINNLENIGIDGFEISNSGFFSELGERALTMPFTAGTDAHSPFTFDRTLMYVFAYENSDSAIVEAILDRRVVVINYWKSGYWMNMTIGDQQWLDEFSYRNQTSHTNLQIISNLITNATNAGWNTSFANLEFIKARNAINHFNFDKAERIFTEILESLYTIDVSFDENEYDPLETIEITISILDSNSATIPVSLNAELLDINKSNVLAEDMDSVASANPSTLSLLIPGTVTGGIHRINLEISFNGTKYHQSYDLMISGDLTAPVVAITSPQHQSTTNSESVPISWTVTELGAGLSTMIIFVDNSQITELSDLSVRSYTLTLTDGIHTIKVQCIDAAGNIGDDEISITVDTTTQDTTTTTTTSSASGFTWVFIISILATGIFINKKKKL
ncbi:MAG: Ig-like domain-containing protein [Candidatus Hodarchaeales archaeon]